MSGAARTAVLVLCAAGIAVVVASALGAAVMCKAYNRMHFISPATSLGAPLIGAALGIENGWGLTTGLIVLIVGLLALTGPALEAATGRVAAQREGLLPEESPQ